MPKIQFVEDKNFRSETLRLISIADRIATDYMNRGFNLSLRQLYYQLVSINEIANSEKSYDKLGRVVSDGRLAGLIDWDHLEDRGREAHGIGWVGYEPDTYQEIVRGSSWNFRMDLWEGQPRRVEVWVEKQALEEVAQRAANSFRSGYFACKGYVSQSEMYQAGQRMADAYNNFDQRPLVLHLGDHDPSGIDMSRDIQERLSMFAGFDIDVRRIALNMEQIDAFNPPPNPAKTTDSRYADYRSLYGNESWELDSIRPEALVELIKKEISSELDADLFNAKLQEEKDGQGHIREIADRWPEIEKLITDYPEEGAYLDVEA